MVAPSYDTLKRFVFSPAVRLLCNFEVEGMENLPGGGYIIASNHLKWYDPVVLSVWFPKQISFGAKTELFKIPGLRKLMEWTEQIPLKREGMTRSELKELLALAKSRMDRGDILGLFPEGTRSKDGKLLDFESGVVLIAAETNRPIVPVGIAYRRRGLKLCVCIRIGEPLESGDRRMGELKRELEERVALLSGQQRAHRRRLKKSHLPKVA